MINERLNRLEQELRYFIQLDTKAKDFNAATSRASKIVDMFNAFRDGDNLAWNPELLTAATAMIPVAQALIIARRTTSCVAVSFTALREHFARVAVERQTDGQVVE